MERDELFKTTVRAIALGQLETSSKLSSQVGDLEEDDNQAYFLYVSAFLASVVDRWFKEDQSQPAIARFVNEMRQDYADADPPIKPLVLEGVIRTVFGEDHLIDEISTVDQLVATHAIIRKVVDQSPYIQERLSDYLNDAKILADAWTAE